MPYRAGKSVLIRELECDLSARLRHSAGAGVAALADVLTAIVQPHIFRSLLSELSSSQVLLDEVASRSVWHPNGFGKIVLLSGLHYKLRLHIWHESPELPESDERENIHNHRWDFAMILLAGSYRHQEYRQSVDGMEFYSYAYQSTSDKSSYSLTPVGVKPLRCVFDARLFQGSRYTIASDVIHRVIPDPVNPPVSLILEGPPKPSSVEVFAREQVGQLGTAPFSRLSTNYLTDNMKAVMTLPIFEAR
jgi:hypothetical protein